MTDFMIHSSSSDLLVIYFIYFIMLSPPQKPGLSFAPSGCKLWLCTVLANQICASAHSWMYLLSWTLDRTSSSHWYL